MKSFKDVVTETIKRDLPQIKENFRMLRELEDKFIERGIPLPRKSGMLLSAEDILLGRRE